MRGPLQESWPLSLFSQVQENKGPLAGRSISAPVYSKCAARKNQRQRRACASEKILGSVLQSECIGVTCWKCDTVLREESWSVWYHETVPLSFSVHGNLFFPHWGKSPPPQVWIQS